MRGVNEKVRPDLLYVLFAVMDLYTFRSYENWVVLRVIDMR